jgi:hypothetical protein
MMAIMALMLAATPAMADNDNKNNDNDRNNHHNGWNDWDKWDNNKWDNNKRDDHNDFNRFDNDHLFFANDFEDDCEWELEDEDELFWVDGHWQWGILVLDC